MQYINFSHLKIKNPKTRKSLGLKKHQNRKAGLEVYALLTEIQQLSNQQRNHSNNLNVNYHS